MLIGPKSAANRLVCFNDWLRRIRPIAKCTSKLEPVYTCSYTPSFMCSLVHTPIQYMLYRPIHVLLHAIQHLILRTCSYLDFAHDYCKPAQRVVAACVRLLGGPCRRLPARRSACFGRGRDQPYGVVADRAVAQLEADTSRQCFFGLVPRAVDVNCENLLRTFWRGEQGPGRETRQRL